MRVVSRTSPVTIFTPADDSVSPEVRETYAAGLAAYRAGRFDAALAQFTGIATQDAPARTMAARVKRLLTTQSPEQWDAITSLEMKQRCRPDAAICGSG